MTEEASSETLVGEELVGDEEVVKAVSLFNIEAVQLIPESFYYNYKEMLAEVAEADIDKPHDLLILQYPLWCFLVIVDGSYLIPERLRPRLLVKQIFCKNLAKKH